MNNLAFIIGRIALASLFLLGGINKIINFDQTLNAMADVGLNPAAILLPLTILLEIGGALIIIFGKPKVHYSAFILALFTLSTNWFFHDFWNMSGEIRNLELSLFFKNVAIAGALILLGGVYKEKARSVE